MTERKSPIEQALDLFFYAPVGFIMNAQEIVEELVEKGHQQVVAARMFGKFAVDDQAPKALAGLQKRIEKAASPLTTRVAAKPAAKSTSAPGSTNGQSMPATQTSAPVATPAATHGPDAAGLAIPDYDSLSASQVVPRLEGLSRGELDAVKAYEAGHRGRKTILSKIDQLQG
jgi:hypothetical protein